MHLRRKFSVAFVGVAVPALLLVAACVGDDPAGTPSSSADGAPPSSGDAGPSSKDDGAVAGNDSSTPADHEVSVPTYCATKAVLTGVADFFCADFDGPDFTAGWKTNPAEAGINLTKVTDTYRSAPNAFTSSNDTTLVWEKRGATTVEEIEVQFSIRPSTPGGVTPATDYPRVFADIGTDQVGHLRFAFVDGGMVEGSVYSGWALLSVACPSSCAIIEKRIPTPPMTDTWTDVKLTWNKLGFATLAYNDIAILPTNTKLMEYTSTLVHIELGPSSPLGAPAAGTGRVAFDNFIVSVKR